MLSQCIQSIEPVGFRTSADVCTEELIQLDCVMAAINMQAAHDAHLPKNLQDLLENFVLAVNCQLGPGPRLRKHLLLTRHDLQH